MKLYLPPKNYFFNTLNSHTINDDYNHALNIWQTVNIQNLQQYAEIYLKVDVQLLADVFESFRPTCLKTYSLDTLHNTLHLD